jgi:hypothetical protein
MIESPLLVRGSAKVYDALLRAYPSSFRRHCEDEMALLFRDMALEAWNRGRWRGVAKLWLLVLVDLIRTVPQQHWHARKGAHPMKIFLSIALMAGLSLIGAGWMVDYLGQGDPHWLDGIGLSLLVVLALVVGMIPWQERDPRLQGRGVALTPHRRSVLGASVLAIATSGIVYTFIAESVIVDNRHQPLAQTPAREIATVVTLIVVFALTHSALKRIQRIGPARRRQMMLTLAGWGLAGVFAVISAACITIYLLLLKGVSAHRDLALTFTFVAALVAMLTIIRTILYVCDRWEDDHKAAA